MACVDIKVKVRRLREWQNEEVVRDFADPIGLRLSSVGGDEQYGSQQTPKDAQGAVDGQVGRRQVIDAIHHLQQLCGERCPKAGGYS